MGQDSGYAVIDLETTGFGKFDRIVEIGVVQLGPDLSVERTWRTLVQPMRDIPNTHIHGISATDVVDAPTFDQVADELRGLMQGRTPVAHNASFEKRFLQTELARAGMANWVSEAWVDTMRLAREYMGVGKLSEALALANITNKRAHSALADAEATAELLRYFYSQEARQAGTRIGQLSRALPSSGEWGEEAIGAGWRTRSRTRRSPATKPACSRPPRPGWRRRTSRRSTRSSPASSSSRPGPME